MSSSYLGFSERRGELGYLRRSAGSDRYANRGRPRPERMADHSPAALVPVVRRDGLQKFREAAWTPAACPGDDRIAFLEDGRACDDRVQLRVGARAIEQAQVGLPRYWRSLTDTSHLPAITAREARKTCAARRNRIGSAKWCRAGSSRCLHAPATPPWPSPKSSSTTGFSRRTAASTSWPRLVGRFSYTNTTPNTQHGDTESTEDTEFFLLPSPVRF